MPVKRLAWVGILALAGAAGAWAAFRGYAIRRAEDALIDPAPMGGGRPSDVGLAFAPLTFASGGRNLEAWLVQAPDSGAGSGERRGGEAVLVLHGNGTSMAEQVGVLQALYRHGITAMVFDYTGFGNNTARPSVKRLREDAINAFRVFDASVGREVRKYALATSLGAAVLLDAIEEVQLGLDGVILVGTFASARELAVREGRVPQRLSFLVPDLYDNVKAVRSLRTPLLVIHSEADARFPIADAERIADAARTPTRLVRLENTGHDEYLTTNAQWTPVIQFIRRGDPQPLPSPSSP